MIGCAGDAERNGSRQASKHPTHMFRSTNNHAEGATARGSIALLLLSAFALLVAHRCFLDFEAASFFPQPPLLGCNGFLVDFGRRGLRGGRWCYPTKWRHHRPKRELNPPKVVADDLEGQPVANFDHFIDARHPPDVRLADMQRTLGDGAAGQLDERPIRHDLNHLTVIQDLADLWLPKHLIQNRNLLGHLASALGVYTKGAMHVVNVQLAPELLLEVANGLPCDADQACALARLERNRVHARNVLRQLGRRKVVGAQAKRTLHVRNDFLVCCAASVDGPTKQ
mmetsp:Transcript_18957/g.60606  ORF Transcript_18957/g.60606 Transcript_18957/m.60606 type:complete len:283 (+) Transcript_18957:79-927(+)